VHSTRHSLANASMIVRSPRKISMVIGQAQKIRRCSPELTGLIALQSALSARAWLLEMAVPSS
jgi:ATP-dependent protease ClpP protease subunit